MLQTDTTTPHDSRRTASKSRGLDIASRGVGRRASSRLVLSVIAKSYGPYSSAFAGSSVLLQKDDDDDDDDDDV